MTAKEWWTTAPGWVKVFGILAVALVVVLLVGAAFGHGPGQHGPGRGGMPHDVHGENSPVAAGALEVAVTANNLTFTPKTLTAAMGTNVAIVLTSVDVLHDFRIDALSAHVKAAQGETAKGGFHAAPAGTYTFYCAEPGHRESGMTGTLNVTGSPG